MNSLDWPVVLSLWYVYKDGKIYCATQKNAKVVEYLRNNPKCAFEIAADEPPYKGVRGQGEAKILDNMGKDILKILMDKYLGKKESNLSQFLKQKSYSEVSIEITPKKIFKYDYSQRMKGVLINEG
jgi:nitroimidazol reductase NimA-like FMN-containing flavoprotein (pyridoxamine 5'-phosphate oxidase superfamily)